jgi:hypothetical protein
MDILLGFWRLDPKTKAQYERYMNDVNRKKENANSEGEFDIIEESEGDSEPQMSPPEGIVVAPTNATMLPSIGNGNMNYKYEEYPPFGEHIIT